jgi:hypothetical protein
MPGKLRTSCSSSSSRSSSSSSSSTIHNNMRGYVQTCFRFKVPINSGCSPMPGKLRTSCCSKSSSSEQQQQQQQQQHSTQQFERLCAGLGARPGPWRRQATGVRPCRGS